MWRYEVPLHNKPEKGAVMKILEMVFRFRLPDDFDGDLNHALILLGRYLREHADRAEITECDPHTSTLPLWQDFQANVEAGKFFTGDVLISDWDGDKWTLLWPKEGDIHAH
jgi:hypothetical protein